MKSKHMVAVFFSAVLLISVALPAGCSRQPVKPVSTVSPGQTGDDTSNFNGQIMIWTNIEGHTVDSAAEFNKRYPNIQVKYEVLTTGDIQNKILVNSAAGIDVADVIWMEKGIRYKLLYTGLFEDLEAPPYNFDRSQLLDWLIPLCTNQDGKIVGLELGPAVASIAYKRSIAKEYFGTDDPYELAKLFQTWDEIIEKGKELKQKSNGKVFMFPSLAEAASLIMDLYPDPLFSDGKIQAGKVMSPAIDIITKINESGIADNLSGVALSQAIGQRNHFMWLGACWTPKWRFEPQAPDESGNWGLLPSMPGGSLFNYGGTLLAIPSGGKNKLLAWQYVKWLRGTEEGNLYCLNKYGDLPILKSMYKDYSIFDMPDKYFGGEKIRLIYAENIDKVKARPIERQLYGDAFGYMLSAIQAGKSKDEIIRIMKDELIRANDGVTK